MNKNYKPRAFIATYQDLGLIKDNVLTILSPKQQVKQYELILKPKEGIESDCQLYYDEKPMKKERIDLVNDAISFYQTASDVLKKKKYERQKF